VGHPPCFCAACGDSSFADTANIGNVLDFTYNFSLTTMEKEMKPRLWMVIVFSLFCSLACSGTTQPSDFERHFQRLESLSAEIPVKGASEARMKELQSIRDLFASKGDSAALFLIQKLSEINQDERKFLKGSEDPVRGLSYTAYLHDHNLSAYRKFAICNILADMFPQLGAQIQDRVLKTLVESYTPSTYFREDLSAMNYAMIRIGPAAIPYWFQLTNHQNENVRCSSSDVLRSIGEEVSAPMKPKPPQLDCHAAEGLRRSLIAKWREWWDKVGHEGPFPKAPSFFESDQTSSR